MTKKRKEKEAAEAETDTRLTAELAKTAEGEERKR